MHARFAEVRLAAAQRIADSAFLERVAEASRDRDKRVYRHCSDLLRERRQGAERARRAADLAQALRQLLAASPLPVSRLLDLEKDLRSLGAGEQEVAECTALVEQARARTRDEAQALRDLQSQAAAAAALLAEVSADPWPLAERLDDWRGRAAALGGPLPDWLAGQANAQALHRTMQDVAALLAERAQDLERAQECERFLAGVASGEAVAEETAAAWEALPKPADADARARLESAWMARQPVSAAAPEPAVEAPPPAVEMPPPPPRPRVDEEAVRSTAGQAGGRPGTGSPGGCGCRGQAHRAVDPRRSTAGRSGAAPAAGAGAAFPPARLGALGHRPGAGASDRRSRGAAGGRTGHRGAGACRSRPAPGVEAARRPRSGGESAVGALRQRPVQGL